MAVTRFLILIFVTGVALGAGAQTAPVLAEAATPPARTGPLRLVEVLDSVRAQYPPYLAALIEYDIAAGRLRSAQGAFDLNLTAAGVFRPSAYYDGNTSYAMLDQGLPFWGGSVYGGYRYSDGFLPPYNKDRAQGDGEMVLGMRLNLLRDGTIDKRRATLTKARIEQELADPIVLKQYLDFIRTASIAYYNWVGAGKALALAESLLQIAKDRDGNIRDLVDDGAAAPIIITDNERLVVSRQINVVKARRMFEKASIQLSLFHRDSNDEPILSERSRLPGTFPTADRPDDGSLSSDIAKALIFRPEVRAIQLKIEKSEIDYRLAKNDMLPNLDVAVEVNQVSSSRRTFNDIEEVEVEGRVEFKMPLQRREARGRVETTEGLIRQLLAEEQFARNKIAADVRDAHSALDAASLQISQAQRNVVLARELEKAESDRLQAGASDLLPLQIREQATFDAQISEVQAFADFFKAEADYRAAIAAEAPASLATP
jgi:outer membrane protein TolC